MKNTCKKQKIKIDASNESYELFIQELVISSISD